MFLPVHQDERGRLVVMEPSRGLPFTPARAFTVLDAPDGTTRGGHALLRCQEFLLAVRGAVHVDLDDGQNQASVVLDDPEVGLHLPNQVHATLRYFHDAILLVLASHPYDPDDIVTSVTDLPPETG